MGSREDGGRLDRGACVEFLGGEISMTTIFGEFVCGSARAPVEISQLRSEECCLALDGHPMLDGELELWIGAIGPFGIVADQAGSRGFTARFKTPLEAEIISHFNA
jgi:hypothetical protein